MSAGRVEERSHLLGLPQLFVEAGGFFGPYDVRGDLPFFQHPEGLWRDAETFVEASGEDHDPRAPLQQSLYVGRLYAGIVARTCLVPVPLFRASGVEPGVLEDSVLGL